jgi:hypothetical protein
MKLSEKIKIMLELEEAKSPKESSKKFKIKYKGLKSIAGAGLLAGGLAGIGAIPHYFPKTAATIGGIGSAIGGITNYRILKAHEKEVNNN